MPLTALNHKFVGYQAVAASTVEGILNALWTLGTKATYANGAARTQGAGSAGTWSRFQNAGVTEAVYMTPATSTLTNRIIFGGATGTPSPSPTMASPNTYAVNIFLGGIAKNAGAFNSWNAASPFTSGQFSGYVRVAPITTIAGVALWESQETVWVQVVNTSNAVYCFCAGALIDPGDGATAGTAAESDGKLYGICAAGSAGVTPATSHGTIGGLNFLSHAASNGQGYFAFFTPGSATMLTANRLYNVASSPVTLTTLDSRYPAIKIPVVNSTNTTYFGTMRQVGVFSDIASGQAIADGGSDVGYVYGTTYFPSTATDAWLLIA